MINIVYIDKEGDFSQATCDRFCALVTNVVRQRQKACYITNTSRIANMQSNGHTAQLIVGRYLGEEKLELADETLFLIKGDVFMLNDVLIKPIADIVTDARFSLEDVRHAIYDPDFDCSSFVLSGAGRLNQYVSATDLWHDMPSADPVWESFKC